jgi:hypothetical protein
VAEAAEEDHEEEEDRRLHGEAVGADEAGERGVEAAGGAGEGGAEREGDRAHPVRVQADGGGGDLAFANGDERAPPARAREVAREQDAREGGEYRDVVVARERERRRAERGPTDVGDTAETFGERVPL